MIFRLQRDTLDQVFTAEMWNGDGTGYVTSTLNIDTVNPLVLHRRAYIGGTGTECALDYVRLFRGLVPQGTLPFGESTANLLDLEFENNLADSFPKPYQGHATGSIAYASSPVYPPYVSQGIQRTLSGSAAQLQSQCFPLNNTNSSLTYQWSQVSGPSTVSWSSQSAVKPTIFGMQFGSYVISLTVTDSSGVSAANVLKYGTLRSIAAGTWFHRNRTSPQSSAP